MAGQKASSGRKGRPAKKEPIMFSKPIYESAVVHGLAALTIAGLLVGATLFPIFVA